VNAPMRRVRFGAEREVMPAAGHVVVAEGPVAAHDDHPFGLGLRDEQTVERVLMVA